MSWFPRFEDLPLVIGPVYEAFGWTKVPLYVIGFTIAWGLGLGLTWGRQGSA